MKIDINDESIEKYLNNIFNIINFDREKDILLIGIDIDITDEHRFYIIMELCDILKDHEIEFIIYPNTIDNIDIISDENKQKYIDLFEDLIKKLKS